MKIGMLTWDSFGKEDMGAAFKELGHSVVQCPFSNDSDTNDPAVLRELEGNIRKTAPDFLFSFNYFPAAAIVCNNLGLPYVSWVYDSPYVRMYHYTIVYPTNYVFVFDSAVYMEFHKEGISTVYYLPMAANTDRLRAMTDFEAFEKTKWKLRHEVAFVGSLYTEKHQFYQRMTDISDYTKGYLEGLMKAQQMVYGYNFIQELLNQKIIEDMQKALPMQVRPGGVESIEYLFAQYVINRQITAAERRELLTAVAGNYGLDLYTPDQTIELSGCTNHGALEAYRYAPYVYKMAAINLNITLRSIFKGIPLRAFEIMGAGGFLLTNFQEDFLSFFVPGEDFMYFESKADLLDKISYFLKNEDERCQIAQNGFQKIASEHTFRHRAEEMISYLK
ncbi:MAG: glycosyltransferase [Lachnospiraceae bacterium]|nr:glycosyltransferase [Lachnospiraceae bacterium]